MRPVSNWPQPSLNGTQPMMQGNCRRESIISFSSASYSLADSGERVISALLDVVSGADLSPLGMSCNTISPSLIAPVVPAGRLDLDVLADHVEAELLRDFEIVLQGFVGRGRVEPVGPEALVERTDQKDRLAVETNPGDAIVRTGDHVDHPQGEVTLHFVEHLLAIGTIELDHHAVELGRVGRPVGCGVGRNGEDERRRGRAAGRRQLGGRDARIAQTIEDFDINRQLAACVCGRHRQDDRVGAPPGRKRTSCKCVFTTGSSQTVCQMPVVGVYQIPDGLFVCLPRGCVPVSVGSQTATANSCGVPGSSCSVTSRVKGAYPPRCTSTCFPSIKTVASQSTASKWSRTRRVPHSFGTVTERRYQRRSSGFTSPHHARKGRFDGEGDEDRAFVGGRSVFGLGFDGKVPQPVEIQPFLANQLRAGVLRMRIGGGDVLGPARHQRSGPWFPIRGVRRGGD